MAEPAPDLPQTVSMSFAQAISTCFRNYVTFDGRARRSEYWWWALFAGLVLVAARLVSLSIYGLAFVVLLLPSIAVATRRLHDTGRSGWWQLLDLVPFGAIVILVFTLQDSAPGHNQYGPSPKAVSEDPYGYGSPTSGYPGTYPATEAHGGDQAGEASPWGRP